MLRLGYEVPRTAEHRLPLVPFRRDKYGRELLLDAGWISSWPDFEQAGRPHRLDFFDLLLITRGRGVMGIDGERHDLSPGSVIATYPGQVRQWHTGGLEGACVFFTDDFVARAFADPKFLDHFCFFGSLRHLSVFRLGPTGAAEYTARFRIMRKEIGCLQADISHKLCAVLYDLLVHLDRACRPRDGGRHTTNGLVDRFQMAVEAGFRKQLPVADYARRLRVSPGHLNVCCRSSLRRTASRVIRDRVLLEARRQLVYTDTPVARIADELGFVDPSYFSRYFQRETGRSPSAFRQSSR